jgi:4-amino-4-deoxy-L-arabinose transferase-like glycosyltransferase
MKGVLSDAAGARRLVTTWLHWLLSIAVGATILQHVVTLPRPFTYAHAWGAAGATVDARAFRISGIAALKAVPMHNNPPFGAHPEAYVHWPPLLALLLTFWSNLFGESEAAVHAFTFVLYLLTTGLLYWLMAANLGRLAAAIGTLSWLTLPVTLRYSHVLLNETLGLPFAIFALIALQKALALSSSQHRWRAAGAAAIVCAVLASWHFAFVPVGLLAAALWNRSVPERRIAFLYLYIAIGAAATVLAWYMFAYPDSWPDMLQTIAYRLGVSKTYSVNPLHNLAGGYPSMTRLAMLQAEAINVANMIGPPGLAALAAFCVIKARHWKKRSPSASLMLFSGLISAPLLWFAVFQNQAAIHECAVILLAPAAAYSLAGCMVALLDSLMWRGFWTLAILGPVLLVVPLARQLHGSLQLNRVPGRVLPIVEPAPQVMAPDDYVQLGVAIREATLPMSVVLTPELSSVPLYYSKRHLIAGVTSEADLARVLPQIRKDFRGYPVYLALLAKDRTRFAATLAGRNAMVVAITE